VAIVVALIVMVVFRFNPELLKTLTILPAHTVIPRRRDVAPVSAGRHTQ
jgi:hypothetical protein